MELKDIVTIALSSAAFCFAVASFAITFRQRTIEDKRSTRKSLTDIVAELAKVDLAANQLELDYPSSAAERIVSFKRTFNTQRRYLANHGEFLADQIPNLVTDIDYMSIARACDSAGDYDKAEKFFHLAVEKSPNNGLRATNLRGLARFWFMRGNAQKGRLTYQQSLQLELPDTDTIRRFVSDTYMMWARIERECGYASESQQVRANAVSAAMRVGNTGMREDMLKQIDEAVPVPAAPVTSAA
jgi:tetratricopeptide (TPR) repeat protein